MWLLKQIVGVKSTQWLGIIHTSSLTMTWRVFVPTDLKRAKEELWHLWSWKCPSRWPWKCWRNEGFDHHLTGHILIFKFWMILACCLRGGGKKDAGLSWKNVWKVSCPGQHQRFIKIPLKRYEQHASCHYSEARVAGQQRSVSCLMHFFIYYMSCQYLTCLERYDSRPLRVIYDLCEFIKFSLVPGFPPCWAIGAQR